MNIKAKLTSRKFWVAVAALVAGIIVLIKPGSDTSQITGLILSLGAVVAYIAGEGYVDAAAAGSSSSDSATDNPGPVVGTVTDTAAATTTATGTAEADQTQHVTSGLSK